jgi:hypothetical protein
MQQQQQLNELMQTVAADAIAYASSDHNLTLTNSVDGLQLVDKLLGELHDREKKQRHSAELVFTLCNIIGAYIGEVFIAHVGGHWQHNQVDAAAPFVSVHFQDKEFPFASVCYHKITRDNNISLYDYVKQAMANAMQ